MHAQHTYAAFQSKQPMDSLLRQYLCGSPIRAVLQLIAPPEFDITLSFASCAGSQRQAASQDEMLSAWICLRISSEAPSEAIVSSALGTLVISVTAGMHTTNITPWELMLTPISTLDLDPTQCLPPGTTAPLQPVWQAVQPQSSQRGSRTAGQPGVDVAILPGKGLQAHRSVHVPLTGPTRRQSAMLGDKDKLLTWRVLLARGQLHLVMFVDCQPPLVLDSRLPVAVEVEFCTPLSVLPACNCRFGSAELVSDRMQLSLCTAHKGIGHVSVVKCLRHDSTTGKL